MVRFGLKPPAYLERLVQWRYAGQAGIAWHRGDQRFVLIHKLGKGPATRTKVIRTLEGPHGEFVRPNLHNTLGWLGDPRHDRSLLQNRWQKRAWDRARHARRLELEAADRRAQSERNRRDLAPRLHHALRKARLV